MRFESKDHASREVDQRIERLDTLGEHLNERAADHERIKALLSDLKDGGTDEVRCEVEASTSEAGKEVRDKFETEHAELSAEQSEAERLEQEVHGEARTDEDNAKQIAEARADLHTSEAAEPLDRASAELQEEAESLDQEAERLRQRNEMSLEEASRLARRVMEGG